MITIDTYDLKKIQKIVIKACLAAYPNRDIGEIAMELNIGRTTLYEKLRKWVKSENVNYEKFEKRRLSRPSDDPHKIKVIDKIVMERHEQEVTNNTTLRERLIEEDKQNIKEKEKEFKLKNKAYLKKKLIREESVPYTDGYTSLSLTRNLHSVSFDLRGE